jgi:hypothetical protein
LRELCVQVWPKHERAGKGDWSFGVRRRRAGKGRDQTGQDREQAPSSMRTGDGGQWAAETGPRWAPDDKLGEGYLQYLALDCTFTAVKEGQRGNRVRAAVVISVEDLSPVALDGQDG